MGTADVQIAPIRVGEWLAAVATSNVSHFVDCGLAVIDPGRAPEMDGTAASKDLAPAPDGLPALH